MSQSLILWIKLLLFLWNRSLSTTDLPNIVFLLIDDMGFGDMSYTAADGLADCMPTISELFIKIYSKQTIGWLTMESS